MCLFDGLTSVGPLYEAEFYRLHQAMINVGRLQTLIQFLIKLTEVKNNKKQTVVILSEKKELLRNVVSSNNVLSIKSYC